MAHRERGAYEKVKRARVRARRAVFALAAVCGLTAIGIGGVEVASEGWNAFLDRPAGVGATPPQQATAEPGPVSAR